MIDRRILIAASVVGVAVIVSTILALVLHVGFGLGNISLVSFPLTLVGTTFAVHQFMTGSGGNMTKYQINHHTHMTPTPAPREPDGGQAWSSMTDREIAELMKSSPDWRSYPDRTFETYRSLGKGFNWLSSMALKSRYVTRQRIMLLLIAISTTGGMWLFLIFAEVMGTRLPNPNYMTVIAQISPLSLDLGTAIVSIFPAVILLFVPLGYLQFKSNYTCPECEVSFSLGSDGRYYRPNKDVEQTENGRRANGYRILVCEQCDHLLREESSWTFPD